MQPQVIVDDPCQSPSIRLVILELLVLVVVIAPTERSENVVSEIHSLFQHKTLGVESPAVASSDVLTYSFVIFLIQGKNGSLVGIKSFPIHYSLIFDFGFFPQFRRNRIVGTVAEIGIIVSFVAGMEKFYLMDQIATKLFIIQFDTDCSFLIVTSAIV